MDKSFESSLSNSQVNKSATLVGVFLQPDFFVSTHPQIFGSPTPRFLPTTPDDESQLDASLTFIGQTVYIKGSSKGILLCSFELQPPGGYYYCVCNPVTREWKALPKPNKIYDHVALAFYCQGNETSLDRLHYTVVQAGVGVVPLGKETTTLVTETFSSKTGEWRESTLTCDSPFQLSVANQPALVVDNVIYWRDVNSNSVAHDLKTDRVEVIQVPKLSTKSSVTISDIWAESQGKIYYARTSFTHFELFWLVKSNGGETEWICIAELDLTNMFSVNPDDGGVVGVEGVHPHDPKRVLLILGDEPVWYNLESGRVDEIAESSSICGAIQWDYFMYEYPSVS